VGTPTVAAHCPIVELVTRSKLPCLSWNRYISSQVASSDYEGVITLWDVHTSAMVAEYEAHTKRIWSVDYCAADPTLLASGSDDCTVKLWSSRDACSVGQLDLKANVCAVAWRPGSAHELAVGSADHAVYLYDLRRGGEALQTMRGHRKAVSYVKWCDAQQLASASTDSTLRLWARGEDQPGDGGSSSEAERVYEGHVNEKNFVGLGADGDFLACGSESNEAFVYYRALSKPIARQGFGPMVAEGGGEVGQTRGSAPEGDRSTFISAVCWRPNTQELLVANSLGTVRVMQLTGNG
jgi:E3 ubiquitin-protein ligase RFWD2